MKDENGLYYYPYPENHRIRMYVRQVEDEICFRMWNADDDGMWQTHGWVPYTAIEQAMAMYAGKGFDPRTAYDVSVARELIDSDK